MKKTQDCFFRGTRSWGQCWGCPNLRCPHMEMPFADPDGTAEVARKAAQLVRQHRVRGANRILEVCQREGINLAQALADLLFERLPKFRLIQAREAWKYGFVSRAEAGRFAERHVSQINHDLSGAEARA